MRFKGKIENKTITRRYFAFRPIALDGEIRWLEMVNVQGYWWRGLYSNTWYWRPLRFI